MCRRSSEHENIIHNIFVVKISHMSQRALERWKKRKTRKKKISSLLTRIVQPTCHRIEFALRFLQPHPLNNCKLLGNSIRILAVEILSRDARSTQKEIEICSAKIRSLLRSTLKPPTYSLIIITEQQINKQIKHTKTNERRNSESKFIHKTSWAPATLHINRIIHIMCNELSDDDSCFMIAEMDVKLAVLGWSEQMLKKYISNEHSCTHVSSLKIPGESDFWQWHQSKSQPVKVQDEEVVKRI